MKGALAAAVTQPIIEINWCNTNGAANSPGHSSGGGIYRDHHGLHNIDLQAICIYMMLYLQKCTQPLKQFSWLSRKVG
ncbi:hypothetical protein Lalb_Chr07g0188771 [Lupinus albus]|uniref:Uncharacterized protein n=1 Tax=Lupinus albus TaxID=3870 RepID=A0A6A4QAG0_LUPAL|nr:hypothetical protein Lalb_Chr07g0188771 [Lupinus albus]